MPNNKKNTSISVIIPVFNSCQNLTELHQRLTSSLQNICEKFEIIMVEDGSHDSSWSVIEGLSKDSNNTKGIQLSRNYGQHNALLCGIRLANHAIIVTLDDDLQNPPEEIHKLINKLNEGYDVVYGTPIDPQHDFLRNVSSQLTKVILQNAMGAQTARQISSFRVFRKRVCDIFENYRGSYINIDVLLTWATTRFSKIGVNHNPREKGTSNYTFKKLAVHTLNMFTGFTTIPLQIASLTGFIFTFFGTGILFYVLGRWLIQGSVVPGFAFLASIIIIFSGAQLFALGIIGEYIARIHFRSMEKPIYNIRTKTTSAAKKPV